MPALTIHPLLHIGILPLQPNTPSQQIRTKYCQHTMLQQSQLDSNSRVLDTPQSKSIDETICDTPDTRTTFTVRPTDAMRRISQHAQEKSTSSTLPTQHKEHTRAIQQQIPAAATAKALDRRSRPKHRQPYCFLSPLNKSQHHPVIRFDGYSADSIQPGNLHCSNPPATKISRPGTMSPPECQLNDFATSGKHVHCHSTAATRQRQIRRESVITQHNIP